MIISKKHIQYFNPKELAKVRKSKKGRKTEKMEKKTRKQNTKEKNEVIEDIKEYRSQRNGSITSKNGRLVSIGEVANFYHFGSCHDYRHCQL